MTFFEHGTAADMSSYRTMVRTLSTQPGKNSGSNQRSFTSQSLMRPTGSISNAALTNGGIPKLSRSARKQDYITGHLSINAELSRCKHEIDKAESTIPNHIRTLIFNYTKISAPGILDEARNNINDPEQSNSYVRDGIKALRNHQTFSRCLIQKLYIAPGRAWEV